MKSNKKIVFVTNELEGSNLGNLRVMHASRWIIEETRHVKREMRDMEHCLDNVLLAY